MLDVYIETTSQTDATDASALPNGGRGLKLQLVNAGTLEKTATKMLCSCTCLTSEYLKVSSYQHTSPGLL